MLNTNSLLDYERRWNLGIAATATCHLPGVNAELGVYLGGSAKIIATMCHTKPLHLFDTFTGIPETNLPGEHVPGDFAVKIGDVKSYLTNLDIVYHEGFFPDTTKDLDLKYSCVHIDADLYTSTKAAIEYFWPNMVSGGIMLFDDYDWPQCPGVKVALEEYFGLTMIVKTCPWQCKVTKNQLPDA